MRIFSRALRILSAITLFFFCWTFLPLYSFVAYAATNEGPGSGGQGPVHQGSGARGKGPERPDERFEKALEAIRENVATAEKKHERGEDDKAEREQIRAKRTELESLDVELRKEFSETEKKLKSANLPKVILDRHYKFVKHYEDNLNELKTNLDGVEKAGTKSERRARIGKAKLHLEKTRPPRKHVPLDPNNLPFQNRKVKAAKAPRLKKEEFEKEFGPQTRRGINTADATPLRSPLAKGGYGGSVQSRIGANGSTPPASPFIKGGQEGDLISVASRFTSYTSRVLLAFNGPASDVPFQLPRPSDSNLPLPTAGEGWGLPSSDLIGDEWGLSPISDSILNHGSGIMDLALTTPVVVDAPTPADLAETPEVQFTPEIRALAAQLDHNPVKIYEWVRNNIEYAPTYGSIQGADQCLQSKICNDMDTASLLIALLRASGIAAKYQYATVEIPIENAMNWVGGVTDPKMAGTILSTNGIPAKMLVSGGTYKAVQLEHVYVSAFIDYIPSRGAVHKQGDTWIPLDPSFKQYTYTQGLDIKTAVPFDAQTFVNQLQSTATINEAEGYVTNVNSALIQQTMQDYQTQVQNYIQQNHPNATAGDVIGKKEIIKQEVGILMGTLPYKMIQSGSEFATVPNNLRATMSFSIPDAIGGGAGLSYNTSLPEIAGKKITLSFSPATSSDEAVIESLLPQPHADGTPIQPGELPTSFPAYLINLKSELRIEGQIVTTGASSMMGKVLNFTLYLNEPGIDATNVNNIVQAGEYYGIGLDTGRVGSEHLIALETKLDAIKTKIEAQTYDGLTKDDVIGDLLFVTVMAYFNELDLSDEIVAKGQGLIHYRLPSVGLCSTRLAVQGVFGIPISSAISGMMMDIDRIMQAAFSKIDNADEVRQYMLASGRMSSALEHLVPERLYATPSDMVQGISAVKALQMASDQGIPVYTVDQSNIDTILPKLQVNEDVKNDIIIAVRAGHEVTVPRANIKFGNRLMCGYIIINPATGAGAYMISLGASGAIFLILVAVALLAMSILAGPIAFAIVSLLMPIYLAFLQWLMTKASSAAKDCVSAIAINILAAITIRNILNVLIKFRPFKILLNSIRMYFGSSGTQSNCSDKGLAY